MAAKLRYPDFLGIGVQKCGTSWLDRNLRAHPDVWLPPIKELHYFNGTFLRAKGVQWVPRLRKTFVTDALKWHFQQVAPENWNIKKIGELAHVANDAVDDEWYGQIFASAHPHQVCGEITPDYQNLPDRAIKHIVTLSPLIKIIILFRDPIERTWSEIRMVAAETGKGTENELNVIARRFDVFERTDYAGALERWSRHIPQDRLNVIFIDDVEREPQGVIAKLCRFLDVRPDPTLFGNLHTPANVGGELPIPDSVYSFLREQLRERYADMSKLYPDRVAAWSEKHRL